MEFVDKFKSMWNGADDEYEEEEVEVQDEYEEESAPVKKKREKTADKKKSKARGEDRESSSETYRSGNSPYSSAYGSSHYKSYHTSPGHSSKVVDIHTTAKLQVVLTKPEKFSDAKDIADDLNEKRTIVLNLESTSKDEALRLLDFLSGVAYANGGEIKKIAKSTFIITPYNVDVMGDLLYELESNGVFFV